MGDEKSTKRVVITAAAGSIGSHLVERLPAEGCTVWGLDNFDPFYARAIKEANLGSAWSHPEFHFAEGDLRDAAFLASLFAAEAWPAAVFHPAARAGLRPSIEQPREPGDVPPTWADIGRTRERLRFDPRFPIEEGPKRFVGWYREQHAGS